MTKNKNMILTKVYIVPVAGRAFRTLALCVVIFIPPYTIAPHLHVGDIVDQNFDLAFKFTIKKTKATDVV